MSQDYHAIQSLLVRYCFMTDRGSAEDIAALFWDDATVVFDKNTNAGVEAFTAGFQAWITKMRDPVEGLRHVLHTPCIKISGDRASAEAYYDADCHAGRKKRWTQLRGAYRDELEKRGGEWRFIRKEVQIWMKPGDGE